METDELSDEELDTFLANLDALGEEKRELPSIPPIEPLLREAPISKNEKKFIPALAGAFAIGILIGALVTFPYRYNGSTLTSQYEKLQHQIDTLSQKISSYEELTTPQYELIEPLSVPSPFDSAA
ncbi:MAG: hypothetical protein S4CHLAM45_12640 [Chlamydiales bacterium]|nr:hypothetical protein [Chlamydiales bacterium]MCH9619753.1 hypothetical protein [Chlamydiales bacterium]MCH9623359.1 hypothetical protein [Chlamydiales bacterium]